MLTEFQHTAPDGEPTERLRVAFVAEAWGEQEEAHGGQPLIGSAGREFFRMLGESWEDSECALLAELHPHSLFVHQRRDWLLQNGVMLTNVFTLRPEKNNLAALCCERAALPDDYALTKVRNESPCYIRPEFLPHLERLRGELQRAAPNLVVALGATASWALLSSIGIGSIRGTLAYSDFAGAKCLPTYHPASVLYQWGNRGTVLADLAKARSEMSHKEIRRPQRQVTVSPDLEWLGAMVPRICATARLLAVDIETFRGQIRCIGFAWARDAALVVPFITAEGRSHWENEEHELLAWLCARQLLESDVPKLFQNGLFDLQYLTRAGIHVRNCAHDTMLLHHTMYPELPKGLGFLGSIYTNESAWKLLRKHQEELKRDE